MEIKLFEDWSGEIVYAFLGDTHVISQYAILPPNAYLIGANDLKTIIPQNSVQKKLWKYYISSLRKISANIQRQHTKLILVLMGDMTEGRQLKIAGRTIQSMNTDDAVLIALDVVKKAVEILQPDVILGVYGTAYHVRDGSGDLDRQLYDKLVSLVGSAIPVYHDFDISAKIGELWWHIAHPYPTTMYQLNPMEKMRNDMLIQYGLNQKNKKYDVLPRAHCHCVNIAYIRLPAVFTIPCFKVKDPYMREKAYLGLRSPDIGILVAKQKERQLNFDQSHIKVACEW